MRRVWLLIMDITVKNLEKGFGKKKVLHNCSAVLKEGKINVIMAPSGMGKTTFINILAGLEAADSGTVEGLEGKRISMVFQENRLCSNLNAVSNIRMVCGKDISRKQINDELSRVGLTGSETQPVRELSGGMKRRVALVRSLMVSYDLIIMDEPFKGLDEKNKIKIMDYTRERTRGKTVILVTHEEEEARYMGGEIIRLQ